MRLGASLRPTWRLRLPSRSRLPAAQSVNLTGGRRVAQPLPAADFHIEQLQAARAFPRGPKAGHGEAAPCICHFESRFRRLSTKICRPSESRFRNPTSDASAAGGPAGTLCYPCCQCKPCPTVRSTLRGLQIQDRFWLGRAQSRPAGQSRKGLLQ